ncbi:hypothetical protein [Streptomyces sp. NPDC001404]|uniref:hypothetical protein n=1 Tax=Streptomyces sp. NPDC001404 TaxID=3364571 RepID=UPI00369F1D97
MSVDGLSGAHGYARTVLPVAGSYASPGVVVALSAASGVSPSRLVEMGGELVGDAAKAGLDAALGVFGELPREVDAGGVVARVGVVVDHREVHPGVDGAQPHPALLRIPGKQVHAVAEQDGLALAGLHAQRQQFGLRPRAQPFLRGSGGHGLGGGLLVLGVLGAGHHDLLRAAEEMGERGVDKRRRVAELAPFGRIRVPGERGQLAGLERVIGGQQLVRGQAPHRVVRQPCGLDLRGQGPVRAAVMAPGHHRLVVQPRPSVDQESGQAHQQ